MSDPPVPQQNGHFLMFWLLAGMGAISVVPCFIVPPVEALMTLNDIEHQELQRVRRLEERVSKQTQLSKAIRTDPRVNTRLAQRELNYHAPGRTEFVSLSEPVSVEEPLHVDDLAQVALPSWIASIYPQRWAAAYRDPRSRHIIEFMALGLIFYAVIAFSKSHRARSFAAVIR